MTRALQFVHVVYDAFMAKRWEELESYLAEDFRFYTGSSKEVQAEEFIRVQRSLHWQGRSYELSRVHEVRSNDESLDVIRYVVEFHAETGQSPAQLRAAEMMVLRVDGDVYRIVLWQVFNE